MFSHHLDLADLLAETDAPDEEAAPVRGVPEEAGDLA
jgi:Tat protein secretion system quality control protein TatD with DNase activity